MSPEQIEGRDVDARTDIYSLGCVIFECLAGTTPFRRETEVAVLWAHMREDPPPLTESRPDLPPGLDAVIAKAMAKAPEDRHSTCRELVGELRQALGAAAAETYADRTIAETDGTAATPTVAVRQPRRRIRDRRVLPALAILGALLVAGVLGAVIYALVRDVEPRVIARPTGTPELTADEEVLARTIPAQVEPCSRVEPLTEDFVAGFVCKPRAPGVIRASYYKPRSGRRMGPYFEKRAAAEGLWVPGTQFSPVSHCGDPPALREWRRAGSAGHRSLRFGETNADGRFLCYRQNRWAALEWTDNDVDVYSIAFGKDLIRLRRWWEARAGPVESG
jgi:hypothetical protein